MQMGPTKCDHSKKLIDNIRCDNIKLLSLYLFRKITISTLFSLGLWEEINSQTITKNVN
jgi:hypothetical protein